jgi:hypothetical protein
MKTKKLRKFIAENYSSTEWSNYFLSFISFDSFTTTLSLVLKK